MKKPITLLLLAAAGVCGAGLYSCAKSDAKSDAPRGFDVANLDTTVSPGTDFYDYACGGWIKANPLKPEFSRFGTFDLLAERSREQVRELINSLTAQENPAGSNAQKIADLYSMGMDSLRLNEEGAAALKPGLDRIASANREELMELMATLPGVDAFFGTGVEADLKDSNKNVMYWSQSGLGLGDRDYYTEDTERNQTIREAYKTFLSTVARLAGMDEEAAARMVENTMAVETALASKQMTRVQLRDVAAGYNPIAVADLSAKYPNINLPAYFKAQGLEAEVDTVVVGQPEYYAAVNDMIGSMSEESLRDYLTAGYIASATPYLSDDFVNARFELSKVLSGVEEQQPRWKRALSVPNGMLGEALGELYVAKYFPASSKQKMTDLVENLRVALGQHIDSLTWMSDATKAKAREKLAAFTVKIGYPDKWRDYSALTIDPSKSYWENIQEAIIFNNRYNLSDYGKPVDRDRWYMSPQTVNAYYNPTTNEICFPAGILQAPYFNPDASDAENYGAIGVVIGHEMTHGFDDQGRQFDKDGNFADWWTEEDATAFESLADKLVAQFDEIEVLPGTHANGRLTLGENIADQGGLRVAYTAYHNALDGKEDTIVEGFNGDQRFYLSYANVWAGNIRDAEILQRTQTDPHSLGRWRVNASLRNLEPFFQAFGIKEGDKMYRPAEERVVIW
ncbi:MAG: M13 family metallopeptidase [Muribaculaceae bacterium]|nr:M13 family metallopeptidase [Muribaculaceae bacterium]